MFIGTNTINLRRRQREGSNKDNPNDAGHVIWALIFFFFFFFHYSSYCWILIDYSICTEATTTTRKHSQGPNNGLPSFVLNKYYLFTSYYIYIYLSVIN